MQPPPNKKRKIQHSACVTVILALMGDDSPMRIRANRRTKMERLMKAFSSYKNIELRLLRFCADGQIIDNYDYTVADVVDLNPSWGDEIKIFVMKEQAGS